jgi:two-component system sensor histidine kinase MtrB
MKGLRPRLVATFALVAAVVAATLATTSYVLVRRAVLDRARDVALRAGTDTVAEAVSRLPAGATPPEVTGLVSRLPGIGEARILAVGNGGPLDYTSTSVSVSPASVPAALRDAVIGDRLAWVRTGTGRGDHVVVGGQLPEGPKLFLFYPLADEVADLESLRNVLAGGGAALVLLSAVVGVVAARGLLRPLRRARHAAYRLEVGLLATRLPEEGDDEFTDLARAFNRMADALERTVGDLRALEASHRRFVSDVSHELRTPLTALTTAADVLEANTDGLNDAGRRSARLLVVESRRLAGMVEDLMEISRFDAGVPSMAWEPVDVSRLVVGALDLRRWSDRVESDLAEGATTYADPRRLDAVVANLVGNALKHGAPPVRVAVEAAAGEIRVIVSDNGPGIPAEHAARIFDRFYKADPARSGGGGSGLGLAIARENARLHGGEITLESGATGTRFTFTLPRRSEPPPAPVSAPSSLSRRPVAEPLPEGNPAEKTAAHPVVVTPKRRSRR